MAQPLSRNSGQGVSWGGGRGKKRWPNHAPIAFLVTARHSQAFLLGWNADSKIMFGLLIRRELDFAICCGLSNRDCSAEGAATVYLRKPIVFDIGVGAGKK
jgi:hypothetical protein